MKSHVVCKVADLPAGQRRIVEVDGKSIGTFNVQGKYYALRNICPHQFAPLCRGKVTGYCETSAVGEYRWVREGEIIRCPWHAWEFDILTGRSIFSPHKVRTKAYAVTVEPAPIGSEQAVEAPKEEPVVESFPVSVEKNQVVLHL